jgi:thioredoxin reductase
MKDMSYDLIIIGAGPAGLYAAYLAGLRQLKTLVLEALSNVGGQLTAFYPDKPIYDIPGFAGIEAQTFIYNLYTQYTRYQHEIPIITSTRVRSILKTEKGFELVTDSTHYLTRYVLMTTGAGSLTPRPLPLLPNHPRVHYSLTQKEQYRNQRLLVLGGGDSALDMTTSLQTVTSHLSLSHRRLDFRGLESTLATLQPFVNIYIPYVLSAVEEIEDGLRVTLKHTTEESVLTFDVDHLFVGYGFEADTAQWKDLAVERIQQKLAVSTMMETSLKGLYAAGHAVMYPGKTNTIATAFGEVNTAVDAITHALRPGKAIPFSSFLNLK